MRTPLLSFPYFLFTLFSSFAVLESWNWKVCSNYPTFALIITPTTVFSSRSCHISYFIIWVQQVCYTFTSYHLKYLTEGLNYGRLTTCIVALYLVKFLSWGISWLGLNDAGDTRKFTSSSFIQFWYFRNAGHLADFYLNSPVNPCSPCIRNWWKLKWKLDRNWLPWAAIFPLHRFMIFSTTQKKTKVIYRLTADLLWIARTYERKFSRDVYFQKGNWTWGAIDGCCPSASKNDQTTPFSLTDPRSPRFRRNIPRLRLYPANPRFSRAQLLSFAISRSRRIPVHQSNIGRVITFNTRKWGWKQLNWRGGHGLRRREG